jgi:hypothetical protein
LRSCCLVAILGALVAAFGSTALARARSPQAHLPQALSQSLLVAPLLLLLLQLRHLRSQLPPGNPWLLRSSATAAPSVAARGLRQTRAYLKRRTPERPAWAPALAALFALAGCPVVWARPRGRSCLRSPLAPLAPPPLIRPRFLLLAPIW